MLKVFCIDVVAACRVIIGKRNLGGKMEVSDRLVALAKANGVKAKEVAQFCKVSNNTVSKWFMGTAMPMRGENLENLSKMFNVSKSYIAFGIAEPTTEEHVLSEKIRMLSIKERTAVNEIVDCLIGGKSQAIARE